MSIVPPTASSNQDTTAGAALRVHGAPLCLHGLEKNYGHFRAVDALSLDVGAGEFVTLLGPSGSGKTTTLLIVAGFQRPTRGSVVLDGRVVTDLPTHKRNIGMVFQNYALFPHKTIYENIAFPLRRLSLGRHEIAARVEQALELVQLPGIGARYPRELSGGQQQRVAVARATVYRPRLLLMDEPLSALDRALREELQVELRRIHRDLGTTVLYVTHDQSEALALSDRIVLMRNGRIEQQGSPTDVYNRPETVFAAGFLGEANLVRGQVIEPGDNGTILAELTNGVRVVATSGCSLGRGDAIVVAVRPEDVKLVDAATDGALSVTVDETAYLGHAVRCLGRFATGERCILRLEPREAGELIAGGGAHVAWRSEVATAIVDDVRDAPNAQVPDGA